MRAFITGHKGFIAQNLPDSLKKYEITAVQFKGQCDRTPGWSKDDEICVYQNSSDDWVTILKETKTDIVIHNAAVVGTDVVGLRPDEATLTNMTGTYNIVQAANKLDIPVVYLGTTVIYDTKVYQEGLIYENSLTAPTTYYGYLKLYAEDYVKNNANTWSVIRPLFAYGGVGDMNSLISKTFYAHKNDKHIDMFLDPDKYKDYMHVEDFCDAVAITCAKGLFGEDYNVSAELPLVTSQIVEKMSELCDRDLNELISWHPKTDYLGNHRLSALKFREQTQWYPKISLDKGLKMSYESILNTDSDFNPLQHLEQAKSTGIDLTKFF